MRLQAPCAGGLQVAEPNNAATAVQGKDYTGKESDEDTKKESAMCTEENDGFAGPPQVDHGSRRPPRPCGTINIACC